MARSWFFPFVALWLVACDDSSSKPADAGRDADTPLDAGSGDAGTAHDAGQDAGDAAIDGGSAGDLAADYCEPLARLVCERGASCGCGAVVPGGELDVAGCVARWTDKCLTSYAPYASAVAAGKARVVGARARACIDLLAELTPLCQRPSGLVSFALCEPFVVTDSAIGETCGDLPNCAGGDGICREGQCAVRGAESEPCQSEFDCQTGLACFDGTCRAPGEASAVCSVDAQCVPPLRCVAGACSALLESGVCAEASACAQGHACVDEACAPVDATGCEADAACGNLAACAAPRTCQPRLTADEPCQSDRACAPELYCGPEQRCVTRPGSGEPCGNGTACADGLACSQPESGDATCASLPGIGQTCALDAQGPFVCAAGLGCVDNVCAALPGEGEVCASGYRCADGLACDFTAEGSFCVAPKALGEPCQNEVVCGAMAHCGGDGTCTADRDTGAPCPAGNECAGSCSPDRTGGISCGPAPGEADPCLFDEDCPAAFSCRSSAATRSCVPELCREL